MLVALCLLYSKEMLRLYRMWWQPSPRSRIGTFRIFTLAPDTFGCDLDNPFNVEHTRLFIAFKNYDVIDFERGCLGSLARKPPHIEDVAGYKNWGHRKAIYLHGAKKSHAR